MTTSPNFNSLTLTVKIVYCSRSRSVQPFRRSCLSSSESSNNSYNFDVFIAYVGSILFMIVISLIYKAKSLIRRLNGRQTTFTNKLYFLYIRLMLSEQNILLWIFQYFQNTYNNNNNNNNKIVYTCQTHIQNNNTEKSFKHCTGN
jgi:hypothetical protein